MVFAKIDNVHNCEIFQQQDGKADIVLSGFMLELEEVGDNCYVYATLEREYDGTWVMPPVQGSWEGSRYHVQLKNIPAGGPYTLRVRYVENNNWDGALNGDVRFRIGVGDIWVVAGQSNAVGYGQGPNMDMSQGRVYILDNSGSWKEAIHPIGSGLEQGEGFCAGASPILSFGNTLARELNYPIGFILTAHGGVPLCLWEKGASLYDGNLEAIRRAGGKVKGIIWYQGCSDTDQSKDAESYLTRFKAMVSDMREALEDETLPFLTVQLNKAHYNFARDHCENWAMVKEAQRQAVRQLEKVWMMTSSDLPLSDFVHNSSVSCSVLGQRLAWQALEQVYHKNYLGTPPDLNQITVKDRIVTLCFEPVYSFLVAHALPIEKSDYLFEDALGIVEQESCVYMGKRCQITLIREPVGKLLCSFAHYPVNSGVLPFDRATGMPLASFYHVEAQQEHENEINTTKERQ